MKYIYVMNSHNPDLENYNMTPMITNQAREYLYSLIEGFQQKNFGLHTLERVAVKIERFKKIYSVTPENRLYADSGGYSILVGKVSGIDIRKLIKCYNAYVRQDYHIFDYIFSLDIAFSLKHQEINRRSFIYEANKESLTDLRGMLDGNDPLAKQVFFVWHWKMRSQYEIFKKLYDELELSRFFLNRSIGGMVGMRKINRFSYSPFTPMVYRCLLDYIMAERFDDPFRLHFLGMYLMYDRFHIAFLEKLCKCYLSDLLGFDAGACFSYDSINFEHTARLDKHLSIYHLTENDTMIECYKTVPEVPDHIIDNVYTDPKINEFVREEISRRQDDVRLKNSGSFGPLSVYSNICLDQFFEKIIDDYELVDLFFQYKSPTPIKSIIGDRLADLQSKYPTIFKPNMVKIIAENIVEKTHRYHRWFRDKRDYETLDELIAGFIKDLGCKDELT
jgi:hypothetical protein